ncbi:MSHA biogenesis protein MshJ [Gammaproteobacteria bacterium]
MKRYWTLFSTYIEERKLSERILMFLAAAGVLIALFNTLFLEPLFVRSHALRATIAQHQAQITALANRTGALIRAAHEPPETSDQTRLQALEQELTQVNASLEELLQRQVPPQKMASLLEDVLQHNHQVRLIALKTLPTTPFSNIPPPPPKEKRASNPPSPDPTPPDPSIYRHQVELTIEGNYADLLTYLNELEKLPWQLFWDNLRFSVEDYPRERITLVLYTLSTERTWLSM